MATFSLHEIARISGGRITQTHVNACPALADGACTCAAAEYRIVRSRPVRKVRGR